MYHNIPYILYDISKDESNYTDTYVKGKENVTFKTVFKSMTYKRGLILFIR